jgi:hypothetical protein
MLTYAGVCWRMLTCDDVCWRTVVDGVIVEAQEASELNRCSMNGSDKPWCATDSDTCGTVRCI